MQTYLIFIKYNGFIVYSIKNTIKGKSLKNLKYFILLLIPLFVFSCGGSNENSFEQSNNRDYSQKTANITPKIVDIDSITKEEYKNLSVINRYRVANKILNTTYSGIGYGDFVEKVNEDYIEQIKTAVDTPLNNIDEIEEKVDRYEFRFPQLERPLAELYVMPLSKDRFDRWMAYHLMNTILFSPAIELETASYEDAKKIYDRLVRMISSDRTINEIIYQHVISQENWRRFRSPEDNVREMMEIYLGRFRDDEVPKAAKACQNWHLSDGRKGYKLIIDNNVNTEPQNVLDTTVTTCYDFYRALSDHKDLIPTVTKVIVSFLFSTYPEEKRERIVEAVLSRHPSTFRDIYKTLIFSKEYIYNVERPKTIEETFFGTGKKLHWIAGKRFFRWITTHYYNMGQAIFTYKLGRNPAPPLDPLSFSYYHKTVRKSLLTDNKNPKKEMDGGIPNSEINKPEGVENSIRYFIKSIVERDATADEVNELNNILKNLGYTSEWNFHKLRRALIIMDYTSRLSELYYFKKIDKN